MGQIEVTVELDADLVEEARAVLGTRNLSGYLNEALRSQLQRDRLGRLLDELELEHGPLDAAVREEVRRLWPSIPG